MSKQSTYTGIAGRFRMPNIVGRSYAPGLQPNSPGESQTPGWPGASMQLHPWPNAVPVLNVLASNPGTPHSRAPVPVVNNYAPLLQNYLFLSGTAGKSLG